MSLESHYLSDPTPRYLACPWTWARRLSILSLSLSNPLQIVEALKQTESGFRSLAEDIDTTTSAGGLVFHVFSSIAEFEREGISERTKEGLEVAKRRGKRGGRPPALTRIQKDEALKMRDVDARPISEIVDIFSGNHNTIRRL